MRILVFNIYFHPDPTGTGLVMGEMVRDLAAMGHEVTIVTTVPHYGLDEPLDGYRGRLVYDERWEGARVLRIGVRFGRGTTLFRRLANYMWYAVFAAPVGLLGPRPDVVVGVLPPSTTGLTFWLVSRIWRAPLVLNVQDVFPDTVFASRWAVWLNRTVERFVLRRAARLTVLSEGQRAALVGRGVDPARIEVIPMWTDLAGVRPGPKNNSFRAQHAGAARLLALYSGNLGTLGGVSVLLEAAHLLRDDPRVRFLIVGRGNSRDELVRRAAQLDLPNLSFLPTQPRERLAEMLAAADVGLVTLDPRLAETSVPSKAFTIMAAGRPVLAAMSARNAVAIAVAECGCGKVVPPDDPAVLAATLRSWADDPSALDDMGRRGRIWAERFHAREPSIRSHAALLKGAVAPTVRDLAPKR